MRRRSAGAPWRDTEEKMRERIKALWEAAEMEVTKIAEAEAREEADLWSGVDLLKVIEEGMERAARGGTQ